MKFAECEIPEGGGWERGDTAGYMQLVWGMFSPFLAFLWGIMHRWDYTGELDKI